MISSLLFFFLAGAAHAKIESSFFTENYLILGAQNPRTSDLNPGNRFLATASAEADLDLRGDWTLRSSDDSFLKIRPRWTLPFRRVRYENPDETVTGGRGQLDLTDAYAESRWGPLFSTTSGLQVYQWGPAEIGNFSNPLFHFSFSQRSLFYKEKGKVLLRANGQWSPRFGQVLLLEVAPNRAPLWKDDEEFRPQALLKSEYQWNSQKYLGVVIGDDEEGLFFVGEYGSLQLTDQVALYADARHTQGARPFRPQTNAFGFQVLESAPANDRFETIGVLGLRLERDNADGRIEYLHNSAGYSADELRSARAAATTLSPWLTTNARRFAKPGLEVPGRDYLYASLRSPDWGRRRDTTAFLRLLKSLQDRSEVWQAALEKNLNDRWTADLEITLPIGGPEDELSNQSNGQIFAGAKWVL